jgi:phosphatidylglycerol:prolipoprotein diacylglycerol transferase
MWTHNIDPIMGTVGGVHFWWYGLSYALGFLEMHLWLRRCRARLGMTLADVYSLSLFFAVGVLLGGRFVEVCFYEWPFYSGRPELIPALWLGGMATHGLLLGAVVSTWLFCRLRGKPFLAVADEMVIPGALLLGLGRIGNFIDGQIVGSIASVPWAVKFPDAEGFRHPVVLYDGIKNLLLIPWLLWVRGRGLPSGCVTAHFLLWYSSLRVLVDQFREYPTTLLGLGTGQSLNLIVAAVAAVWAIRLHLSRKPRPAASIAAPDLPVRGAAASLRRLAFACVLVFSVAIPSDWTQDVPERYGRRHEGLKHSLLYPPIHAEALPENAGGEAIYEECPWAVPPSGWGIASWVELFG